MSYSEPPQNPYGAPGPYGGQPQQSTSVLSIVALVLGIISVPGCGCFVFSIAAIITGFLGRNEVAKSGGAKKGGGMATAGLIIGIITLVVAVVINALVLADVINFDYYSDLD
jgi:Domain of unknown function (DUF4190)